MRAKFVKKVKENKTNVYSFYFQPEEKLKFNAGQFTQLTLKGIGSRWFSISSDPNEPGVSITTRIIESNFKLALHKLQPGDEVTLADAMGDFVLPLNTKIPVVMVAGGIGITPFLSILKDNLNKDSRELNLLYTAATKDDLIDISPYKHILKSYKEIIGRTTVNDILESASGLNDPYIYVSGPEAMTEEFIKGLEKQGIASNHLIGDYFNGY